MFHLHTCCILFLLSTIAYTLELSTEISFDNSSSQAFYYYFHQAWEFGYNCSQPCMCLIVPVLWDACLASQCNRDHHNIIIILNTRQKNFWSKISSSYHSRPPGSCQVLDTKKYLCCQLKTIYRCTFVTGYYISGTKLYEISLLNFLLKIVPTNII